LIAKSFAMLLTLAALICFPAAANQIGDHGGDDADRILIADPSHVLRTYMIGKGFKVESLERLEAINLSLMVASPPDHVPASVALRDLRMRFPKAIVALDDRYHLAQDTRPGGHKIAKPQQILTAIHWEPDESEMKAGIRVGVIDSSLDLAHPALQGAAIVQRTFTSRQRPATDTAHGTAIAAMLVGRSDDESVSGLLRGATLFYASIFQGGEQGPIAGSADFLRGVNWLIKSGVTVINASVTSPTENPVVLYAMSLLSREKVILVAAAGNRGPSADPVYPAAIPSAFAVTAVSIEGDAYRDANVGDYIDISAPGIDLPTTSRKITSGTSLAVPFVTAAVARIVQVCGVSPKEAEASLQANARDLGPLGRDAHFGWGLLQALPGCGGSDAGAQLSASGASRHPPSTR
jgi:subtilisin family serine protease